MHTYEDDRHSYALTRSCEADGTHWLMWSGTFLRDGQRQGAGVRWPQEQTADVSRLIRRRLDGPVEDSRVLLSSADTKQDGLSACLIDAGRHGTMVCVEGHGAWGWNTDTFRPILPVSAWEGLVDALDARVDAIARISATHEQRPLGSLLFGSRR